MLKEALDLSQDDRMCDVCYTKKGGGGACNAIDNLEERVTARLFFVRERSIEWSRDA
jgi:hypothetical protein